MTDDRYRVYNHTDRELILATDSDGKYQYRLLAQSVSPLSARPVLLWEVNGAVIDGVSLWSLAPGFDVHVSETGTETEIGAGPPMPRTRIPHLHISGLGTRAMSTSPPAVTAGEAWFYREDEIWVTVLGAGVTGLTVAHELVTRGFRVQVIERAHGSPADVVDGDTGIDRFRRGLKTPDVGGIARTQWGTQPLARASTGIQIDPSPDLPHASGDGPEALRSVHGDAIWFGADRGGRQQMGGYKTYGITWTAGEIDEFAADLEAWLRELSTQRSLAALQLVIVVYGGGDAGRVLRGYQRLRSLLAMLAQDEPDTRSDAVKSLAATLDRLQVLPTARIDVSEAEPSGTFVGLMVRVHEDLGLIAGEHGFRFFPGFYRHLRDTMQRTPIFDPVTQTFTPRTVRDNLQEVAWQVIADPSRPFNTPLQRKPFTTIGGLIEQYRVMRRGLGYRPVDVLRFALRLLRYATSSTQRRAAYYEDLSWWAFLAKRHLDDPDDKDEFKFGERFAQALRHTPKALVAMGAEYADARTQGNINVQLLMDEFGLHDQGDSTLTGPTSTSWLTHWRTYLEQQGVRFFLGEVTEIAVAADREHRARVAITFPDGVVPIDYLDGEAMRATNAIYSHYIVSALDVVNLARLTTGLRRSDIGAISDLDHLIEDSAGNDRDLEDITQLGQTGPGGGQSDRFQTLTGLQLYYQRHVSFSNGHIYYAASPWGLSAISQVQFWGPFGSGHRGRLLGNLSIDIGSWRADGDAPNPNDLARDDIAARVQTQIARTNHDHGQPQPGARFYHLDDFIGFALRKTHAGDKIIPARNHAPFLINVTSEWKLRPRGEPWSPDDDAQRGRTPGSGKDQGPVWVHDDGGYLMHFGNLVTAGTHMRTFTRMGTMEAANESARHAVNAILDHATFVWIEQRQPTIPGEPVRITNVDKSPTPFGDYCDIWDPEQAEFDDLDFLKLIDAQLMVAGTRGAADDTPEGSSRRPAPHLFDILRIDELPDFLETDRDAVNALELIGSTLRAFAEVQVDDVPGVLAMIERARGKLAEMLQRARR